MDGSDHKSFSSSTTIKPSSTPNPKLSASGADENAQSYEEMAKKPPKHFMSATASSASKAIAPRKKILGERNENTETQFQKSPNVSICDDSDSLSVSDDSYLKAYDDPSTNSPSPRPKFLRYKPNGRREIILRYEKDVKERANLVGVSQEGEAVEERDEEVEEAEEEEEMGRGGFLRRFLEFVLVMLVLVFSTIYISSMNSPTSSPVLQALEGLKDGWYLKIHDRVYETVKGFRGEDDHYLKVMEFKEILKLFGGGGSEFMDGNTGLMKLNQTVFDEEEEIVENVYLAKVEEMIDYLGEVNEVAAELQGGENDEVSEMVLQAEEGTKTVLDHRMEKSGEGFDQMLENFDLKRTEDVEKLESFEDTCQQESGVVMDPVQEVNNVAAGDLEMVDSEMEKSENINAITNFETQSFEVEGNLKEGLVEQTETDIVFKAVIGFTLFSVVIVSLAMALHRRRKRNIGKDLKQSSPIIRPCSSKTEEMEKCSSEIPNVREEHVKCVDFSSPMSLISNHSNHEPEVKESSISLYQSQGPSIELLGEFEVVQMSPSLRSCGVKSRMAESEVSSHSVSLDNEFGNCNKAHSVPLQAQPSVSEFSAINSFSYGYFTPEKKILKKEDGRDAETKKVVVTPVRRSSRIRNRAITSP